MVRQKRILFCHCCHAPPALGRAYRYDIMSSALVIPTVQQMVQQAQRMSLVAQVLCGLVVVFYLLGFAPKVEENLAATPA